MDPAWVWERGQILLSIGVRIDPTPEEKEVIGSAYQHLPVDVRPTRESSDEVVETDDGYAVLHHPDEHVTDVVAIDLDKRDLVLVMRLDAQKSSGTIALYRDGERLTLPW